MQRAIAIMSALSFRCAVLPALYDITLLAVPVCCSDCLTAGAARTSCPSAVALYAPLQVDMCLFDKTGTLTTDELVAVGVAPPQGTSTSSTSLTSSASKRSNTAARCVSEQPSIFHSVCECVCT